MNITPELRLVLVNQYRILEMLCRQQGDRREANEFSNLAAIFWAGIEDDYPRAGDYLADRPSISPSVSRFLQQVVEMYAELQSAAEELELAPDVVERTRFPLFHYAVEREHSYGVHHFVNRLNLRSGRPIDHVEYRDIPARAMAPVYERMLLEWRRSKDLKKLTAEDVTRIVAHF